MRFVLLGATVLSLALLVMIIASVARRIRVLPLLCCATMVFVLEYLYAAVTLLALQKFRVSYTLVFVLLVNLGAFALLLLKKRLSLKSVIWDIRQDVPIVLIVAVLLSFTFVKSESFNFGYDAGVYASKAIDLLYGDTRSEKTLEEYEYLEPDEYERMYDSQLLLTGMYPTSDDKTEPGFAHTYHGLPTWPALLALSGRLLGVQHMMHILSVLFALSCLCLYFAVEKLRPGAYVKYLAVALWGCSPLVLYLAKISLSEMLYATLLMFCFWALTFTSNRAKLLAGFAGGLLGFVHIGTFIYIPVLFLGLWMLWLHTKNSAYLWVNAIMCGVFSASMVYAFIVSGFYAANQMHNSLWSLLPRGTSDQAAGGLLVLMGVLLVGVSVWHILLQRKKQSRLIDFEASVLNKIAIPLSKVWLCFLLAATVYRGYQLGFTDHYLHTKNISAWYLREYYANKGLLSLLNLNLFSVLLASSFIFVVYLFFRIMIQKKPMNVAFLAASFCFLYVMTVYTVRKIDTPVNPYVSRYFAQLLLPALVLAVVLVLKNRKALILALCLFCFVVNLPVNQLYLTTAGYRDTWQMIDSALELVPRRAMVFVSTEDSGYMIPRSVTLPLRDMNENLVFPITVLEELHERYPDVPKFIVSDSTYDEPNTQTLLNSLVQMPAEIVQLQPELRVWYPTWEAKSETPFCISVLLPAKTELDMSPEDNYYLHDFHAIEAFDDGSYARWTRTESRFKLSFDTDEDQVVRIHYRNPYPEVYEKLGKLDVAVSCEGHVLYEGAIDGSEEQLYIDVPVAAGIGLSGERHTFELSVSGWVVKDVVKGSADTREVGLSVTGIEVLT